MNSVQSFLVVVPKKDAVVVRTDDCDVPSERGEQNMVLRIGRNDSVALQTLGSRVKRQYYCAFKSKRYLSKR